MKDINFFEPYKKKPQQTGVSKAFIIGLIFSLIVVLGVLAMGFRYFKISDKEKTVANLEELATDPVTLQKVEKIRKKQAALNDFSDAVRKIEDIDTVLEQKDMINEELFINITDRLPETVYMNAIEVTINGFDITGVARDRYSIADFQKALTEIPDVTDVFISDIVQENGFFNFTLNVAFHEVNVEDLFETEEDDDDDESEEGNSEGENSENSGETTQ